jgi:hypothetical protein
VRVATKSVDLTKIEVTKIGQIATQILKFKQAYYWKRKVKRFNKKL